MGVAGCRDAVSQRRDATAALGVPLRMAGPPRQPVAFSGRVPRRSGAPGEVLRMGRSFGDSTRFARISSLRVIGDRLLVTDRVMSKHLAVIDLGSGAIRWQDGREGQGPGEFRDPFWAIPAGTRPPSAWIYDFQNRRLTKIDLDAPGPSRGWESRPLDVGLGMFSPTFTRTGMVANGLFPDFTLLLMDSAGAPRARVATELPFGPREMRDPNGRMLLNRSFLAVQPSGGRMALVYQFRPRIDFFTTAGELYGRVEGPRATKASYRMAGRRFLWNDDNQMANWGTYATERYVYVLFCGCRIDEERLPSVVQVYGWNGDLVREFALDRQVLEFAVSPDDRFLYAGTTEPYPTVGEWRLPAA